MKTCCSRSTLTARSAWPSGTVTATPLPRASGRVWVEDQQIAFHFSDWTGAPLWDTETVLGEPFVLPFRMRTSYTLQGSS